MEEVKEDEEEIGEEAPANENWRNKYKSKKNENKYK